MTTNRGDKQTGGTGADVRGREDSRAAKRAQFTEQPRRSPLMYVLVVLAVTAAVIGGVFLATRGGDAAQTTDVAAQVAPVEGGTVSVPLDDLADGEAQFYSADVGGTTVKYFLVQDASGEVRTAFDACDVCYPAKKGYTQDGDVMVCNNCGRRFATKGIGAVAGGCNPSPLKAKVKGGEVLIGAGALTEGVRYFQ